MYPSGKRQSFVNDKTAIKELVKGLAKVQAIDTASMMAIPYNSTPTVPGLKVTCTFRRPRLPVSPPSSRVYVAQFVPD